ncbi:hypothetical protein ACFL35_19025 [Candidatus Riflebacteria bacterium]
MNFDAIIKNISGFARIFNGVERKHYRRIDCWTTNGRGFKFRLANKRIFFTRAFVGEVHNPGKSSDHALGTTVSSLAKGCKCIIRIENYFTKKRLKIYWNNVLVGDSLYIIKQLPSPLRVMEFPGSAGVFSLRLKSGKDKGTLDDVFIEEPADAITSAKAGEIKLDRINKGTRQYQFQQAGMARVSAKLSTYGPATLQVTIKKKDGKLVQWIKWSRVNGTDPSPLYLFGKPYPPSMFERKPGDYSPTPVNFAYKAEAGDTFILSLNGEIGAGTPFLILQVPTRGSENPSEVPATSVAGWNVKRVKKEQVFNVNIPYSRNWSIIADGIFKGGGEGRRFFQSGTGGVHTGTLDWFPHRNDLVFRLAHNQIFFTSNSRVGRVNNPYGSGMARSDHAAGTVSAIREDGSRQVLKVEYNPNAKKINGMPSGRLKAYINSAIVGDFEFVITKMPKTITQIKSWGFTGTFKYKIGK